MTRLVDLDDIAGLEQAINELHRLHDLRDVDPELRADIERAINEGVNAGRITDDDAARLRSELDEVAPAALLEANFKELVPNRPALGAHKNLRSEIPQTDPLEEARRMDREDPDRLRGLVREIATFTDDVEKIVAAAVAHARKCGISEEVFEPIIIDAVRELHNKQVNNVG